MVGRWAADRLGPETQKRPHFRMPGKAVASAATSPCFRARALPAGEPDAARPARDPGNRPILPDAEPFKTAARRRRPLRAGDLLR